MPWSLAEGFTPRSKYKGMRPWCLGNRPTAKWRRNFYSLPDQCAIQYERATEKIRRKAPKHVPTSKHERGYLGRFRNALHARHWNRPGRFTSKGEPIWTRQWLTVRTSLDIGVWPWHIVRWDQSDWDKVLPAMKWI